MKKYLSVAIICVGLSGCMTSPQQEARYTEIMMNGEVLSSSTNQSRLTTSIVKHENVLYTCYQNPSSKYCTDK